MFVMSECPTCGGDPCANPSLCRTSREADQTQRNDRPLSDELPREANKRPAAETADDWLAAFAKRSNEALAAKAAEKQVGTARRGGPGRGPRVQDRYRIRQG